MVIRFSIMKSMLGIVRIQFDDIYIEAAREGGLDVKDPTPTDRPAEEPARVDHYPDTVPASGDIPK